MKISNFVYLLQPDDLITLDTTTPVKSSTLKYPPV